MFVVQFIASVGCMIVFPKCRKQYQESVVFFFSVWVAAIDILFIIFLLLNPEIAFLSSGASLMLQFGVPFMVATVVNAIHFKQNRP